MIGVTLSAIILLIVAFYHQREKPLSWFFLTLFFGLVWYFLSYQLFDIGKQPHSNIDMICQVFAFTINLLFGLLTFTTVKDYTV